jgi:hypothetical protein
VLDVSDPTAPRTMATLAASTEFGPTIGADGLTYLADAQRLTLSVFDLGACLAGVCGGDTDGDGATDHLDFATIAANFGAGPDATRVMGDLTGDGWVDVFDFAELADGFGCGAE